MWSPGAQEGDSADRGGGWREGPSEARSGELGPGTTPAMSGPHTGPLLEAPGTVGQTPPGTPQVRAPDDPESGRGERSCRQCLGEAGWLRDETVSHGDTGVTEGGARGGRSASMWCEGLGPGVRGSQ